MPKKSFSLLKHLQSSGFLRLDLAERCHPHMYWRKHFIDTVGKSNLMSPTACMASHPSQFLDRLKELLETAALPVNSKQVKLEAWFVKGCCVLIKKKLSRGQWPKARNFRLLMAAALGSDDTHDEDPEPEGEPRNSEDSLMKETNDLFVFSCFHIWITWLQCFNNNICATFTV